MRRYLDDDCAAKALIDALRRTGHDVQTPRDVSKVGVDDAVHLLHAVLQGRVTITGNYDDFENLHNLIIHCGGSHPGVLAIRKDRDRKRNMSPMQIATAITKLIHAIPSVASQFVVLNHWR